MINILTNNFGHCIKESKLCAIDINLYNKIIEYNVSKLPWNQMVYNYLNSMAKLPKCACGGELKFISFKEGYRKYCSIRCATNSLEYKEKKENTLIEKYGVKNISQSELIKKKKELTLLNNYGVSHPLKSMVIKKRVVITNNCRWGVDNVSQSSIVAEKKRNTTNKNFGVDYNFQSNEIKKNIKSTIKNKYGVDYYVQSIENKQRITETNNEKKIKFWTNRLKIDSNDIEVENDKFIIKNLCKIHNQFEIDKYNLYNRSAIQQIENICTICNPISKSISIKENEIRDFIENELNINTEKIRISNKEIDIFLPKHNLGIEFDGLYWHSNIYKNKNYHLNKTELCESQNIQLLHVFEDEWMFKKSIVKSIIKSKLGIVDNKIFARKCEIIEINSKLCSNFLNVNHIQGSVNSKIKIGLFYNNELVSVMTFGKKRLSMGNKQQVDNNYEILRFCNKLNTVVIGGASKMLKFFIKKYRPDSITTFADRRYSQGDLYVQLKFTFCKNTVPNYYYFHPNNMIRYHRFKFRKDVLVREGFDSTKTEHQIMAERGYSRIYDSGHMKFEILFDFNI